MGWSGENFHKANIFMNSPDAVYNPFAFSFESTDTGQNPFNLIIKLSNFGKIFLLFSYKSIDIDRNTQTFHIGIHNETDDLDPTFQKRPGCVGSNICGKN